MAHEIWGKAFAERETGRPAWHGIATATIARDADWRALDALETLGDYNVETVPLVLADESALVTHRALVRRPSVHAPDSVVFGIVGPDYTLITPRDFAALFDVATDGAQVETVGFLREGRVMFITTKLPSITVRGDDVDMYLIARNGMDGSTAAGCDLAPVRVVCANTLRLSEQRATESFRVVHDRDAMNRLGTWMATAYRATLDRVETVKAAFDVLAATRVTKPGAIKTIEIAYPLRAQPERVIDPELYDRRVERWEYDRTIQLRKRDAALALFQGDGRGMDHPAAKGTAWGLYNAIVETEDYRKGNGASAVAEATLFGYRADIKARAFDHLLTIASK